MNIRNTLKHLSGLQKLSLRTPILKIEAKCFSRTFWNTPVFLNINFSVLEETFGCSWRMFELPQEKFLSVLEETFGCSWRMFGLPQEKFLSVLEERSRVFICSQVFWCPKHLSCL